MATVSMTFKKGERPPALTAEQKAMLTRLKAMPDSEIDTSDDWGDMAEKEALTVQSDKSLIINFTQVCHEQKLSVNEVLNQLMQAYVKQHNAI